MGGFEHNSPVLQESFLAGVSLEEMVSGLTMLGIGFPFSLPDYAVLPVIYSANLISIRHGSIPDETVPSSRNFFHRQNKSLITLDSCEENGGERKKISEILNSKYVVLPEVHASFLDFVRPANDRDSDARAVFNLFKQEVLEAYGNHRLKIEARETKEQDYVSVLGAHGWGANYPVFVTPAEMKDKAMPILDEVRAVWTEIIGIVNRVAAQRGRKELLINPKLADVIADYSLNSRYNALSPTLKS